MRKPELFSRKVAKLILFPNTGFLGLKIAKQLCDPARIDPSLLPHRLHPSVSLQRVLCSKYRL